MFVYINGTKIKAKSFDFRWSAKRKGRIARAYDEDKGGKGDGDRGIANEAPERNWNVKEGIQWTDKSGSQPGYDEFLIYVACKPCRKNCLKILPI